MKKKSTMDKPRIACVVGTRPEVIKMAPLILELQCSPHIDTFVVSTGQHKEMLSQALDAFQIEPDYRLEVMGKRQTLPQLTSKLPEPIDQMIEKIDPHFVIGQGDTTTVLMVALGCHYRKIPFGHIEAGLRTGVRHSPFPEEMNRVLVSRLTTLHFAPTTKARENLLQEGISTKHIWVTGNTVIDAVDFILSRETPSLPDRPYILVTSHRRENIGKNIDKICLAIQEISQNHPSMQVLFSLHLNPDVSQPIRAHLSQNSSVHLLPPLPYAEFLKKMYHANLVLTDSGGVQEEAAALKTPTLVLREQTERTEALDTGHIHLVGTDPNQVADRAKKVLSKERPTRKDKEYLQSPFGDGQASLRIRKEVERFLL